MNMNELFNEMTNIKMKRMHIGGVKEEVKCSNAEIVFLGEYTFNSLTYDEPTNRILASIKKIDSYDPYGEGMVACDTN